MDTTLQPYRFIVFLLPSHTIASCMHVHGTLWGTMRASSAPMGPTQAFSGRYGNAHIKLPHFLIQLFGL
eukprot:jgi/Botrbrau1/13372/Bobra.0194s0005.1